MSTISKTYTYTDGTTAYGSQVETDLNTIYTAWNAHDAGTSAWSILKVTTSSPTDAQATFSVTGVDTYSIGVDVTDSAFKISNSTALGTTDYFILNTSGAIAIGPNATISGIFSMQDNGTSDIRMLIYKSNATGDPYVTFATNATNWSIGVDNSDSDSFKVSMATTIGTSDYFILNSIGSLAIGPNAAVNGSFSITDSGTGHIRCLVNKANATGDPYWNFSTDATNWSIGIDNSDTDALVITQANTLDGTNYFKIETSGKLHIGVGSVNANLNLNTKSTSGANTATMTNGPTAGNPAGWLVIEVNGTERNIPYWA